MNPPTGGFFCEELMNEKIAILFVNGEFEKSDLIMNNILQSNLLIAVDGGLDHIVNLGLSPQIIMGDLDSIDVIDQEFYENNGVDIIRFPERKDETDLELAMNYVMDLDFDQIFICGAGGGRADHFLGNLFLLSNPNYLNKEIKILTKNSEIFYCKKNQRIQGNPGDLISLIPITENVIGVETKGLEYPLEGEDLLRWKTRGISNLMVDRNATITFETGSLICVHYFRS
jgi:thiamine pyrophosphokinase